MDTSPVPHASSSFPTGKPLPSQLEGILTEYRRAVKEWVHGPSQQSQDKLTNISLKLRDFLEKNELYLSRLAHRQGWMQTGINGYQTYFTAALHNISEFLFNPNAENAQKVSEELMQFHFQLTHKPY